MVQLIPDTQTMSKYVVIKARETITRNWKFSEVSLNEIDSSKQR